MNSVLTFALHFHFFHSRVSTASFAAVSGFVPIYADLLGIHGAGRFEIWTDKRWLDGHEAHWALPSIT
jgi:hypothetical protein